MAKEQDTWKVIAGGAVIVSIIWTWLTHELWQWLAVGFAVVICAVMWQPQHRKGRKKR